MRLVELAKSSSRVRNSKVLSKAPLIFIGLVAVSGFLPVNDKVKTSGLLVPEGRTFEISAIETSHVKSILVEDFSEVKKGQQLLILSPIEDSSRLPELESRIDVLTKNKERVIALAKTDAEDLAVKLKEFENSEDLVTVTRLADFDNLLKSAKTRRLIASNKVRETSSAIQYKKSQIENAKSVYDSNLRLAEKGLISKSELSKSKQDYDNALAGYENGLILLSAAKEAELEASIQIDKVVSNFNKAATDEMVRIDAELGDLIQKALRLRELSGASVVTAPVDGRVKFLTRISEGSLHQGGAALLEVVPRDVPLYAEISIPVQLRNQLEVGQQAKVRVQSNSNSNSLSFQGSLKSISPNITIAESGERFYMAKVIIKQSEGLVVFPGLAVDVIIQSTSRSLFSKLVKPLGN